MFTPPPCGEGVELAERVVHLAGRDADGAAMGDGVGRRLALARGRLLPPIDADGREFFRGAQRVGLGEPRVHIDQDVQLGKTRADRRENVVGELQFIVADEALRGAERVDLQRVEAHGDDVLRRRHEMRRRALGAIPAVGVGENGVADLAAEQLPDRHAEVLAEDVPARDLDGGDGGAMDVAAVERDAVEHPLREGADVLWILPDDEMLQLAHRRFGRLDETVERALAEPDQAGVGVDVDEEEIATLP